MLWQAGKFALKFDRPLIMGILNVTLDSFSDGGRYILPDKALRRAEEMIAEGADIIDIGGESTRPGGAPVASDEEIRRVVPVIGAVARRFDIPISIDTHRSQTAAAAADAGATIVNDISGLRFDRELAAVAAQRGLGLILMHSRGDLDSLHSQPPVHDILAEVTTGLSTSISAAEKSGVPPENIVLDIGLGFGKTVRQNFEMLGHVDTVIATFPQYPLLVGASRKSFIGKVSGDVPPEDRLAGSIACAALAVYKGANILRVHDVKETVAAAAAALAAKTGIV